MFNDNIFSVIKKHIDDMDYLALLEGGAPCDEFDGESGEISRLITAQSTVSEIAEAIADVFTRNFGEPKFADDFTQWAAMIKNDLIS